MSQQDATTNLETWTRAWLAAVVAGSNTVSQRKLTSINKYGGMATARRLAKAENVHLLMLEDDQGDALVAASMKPFKVVC